jgi:hypothetical protein
MTVFVAIVSFAAGTIVGITLAVRAQERLRKKRAKPTKTIDVIIPRY